MPGTTPRYLVSVLILVGVLSVASAQGRDSLSVSANAPTVSVAPRDSGRSFMRLPTLEYVFEIHAKCSDGRMPKSISLNVADTRMSLAAEQIASDGPTEFSLQVPASQIAPLAIENFCIAEDGDDENIDDDMQTELSVESALSAQASLLCEGEDDRAMTYVSRPLDVSLVCDAVSEEEETLPE